MGIDEGWVMGGSAAGHIKRTDNKGLFAGKSCQIGGIKDGAKYNRSRF